MTAACEALTFTERELTDLGAAVRAHRRTLAVAADRDTTLGMQAAQLALLSVKLTDALDAIEAVNGPDAEIAPGPAASAT